MGREILGQLCELLKSPDAELQCAAARVLGALKTREPAAREALVAVLTSSNQMVVAYAVDALGRMGDPAVLPHLLQAFAGPPASRERAVAAVAAFGPAALPALRQELKSKNLPVRRGILEVFAQTAGEAALDGLLEGIQDADAEAVQFATGALRKRVEGMGDKDRAALFGRLKKLLDRPAVARSVPAATAVMKLFGFLRRPEAAPVLLAHLDRKAPMPVRRNALVSLEHLDPGGFDVKAVVSRVLPLLADEDFPNIVSPALAVLGKVTIPKALSSKVLPLQKSPHPAVRAYASRALGSAGTAQAADALLAALASADFRDREQAAIALRANPEFALRLAGELERAKDLTFAWSLAGVLRQYRGLLPKPLATRLLRRGVAHLAKQDEERAKAFIEVTRSAAPEPTRAALLKGGLAWLRKKRFETAEGFLRYMERDDLVTPEGLYALAIARCKRGGTSLDPAVRGKNPALPLFVRLFRRGDFPVAKRLYADRRLLAPGDLLYLGFHFVDQEGPERSFGADVLKALIKAYPKSAEAKAARQRLGLG